MPQGTLVGAIRIVGKDGAAVERPLRAGIELADQAHQRSDVKDRVRHQLATVFEGSSDSDTQSLVTFSLDQPMDVERVEIDQVGFAGWIEVDRLTLSGPNGDAMPQTTAAVLLNEPTRWREVRRFKTSETTDRSHDEDAGHEEDFVVFENLRVRPRAWVTPTVVALSPDDQRDAFRLSILPDGAPFDARETTLVFPADVPAMQPGLRLSLIHI